MTAHLKPAIISDSYTLDGISGDYTLSGISEDYSPEAILPDHAVAWCAWMREQIKRVEDGQAVHEVCADMILPVTFGARRI